MNGKKFNSPQKKPVVLVAPLDWGLGHATRCIPVIIKLLEYNCEVIIAADGDCKLLLEKEFPDITFLYLRGYRIQYSRKKIWLPVKLFIQFPKIIFTIYTEHAWLKKAIKKYSVDFIISDNRPGLHNPSVACVYITHQLQIKTGNGVSGWLAQKIHYRFIKKFRECWVPDMAGELNLAGELSHPVYKPKIPVRYMGPLSRFGPAIAEIKYDLLFLLSGPEPQRTVFEDIILKELRNYSGSALLVRGLPQTAKSKQFVASPGFRVYDHLPAKELNAVILQSELVVARSGYTTVMDLVKLKKKAILVPTPGQTEQEYLARYLMEQGLFYYMEQNEFSLFKALKGAAAFSCKQINIPHTDYEKIIETFLHERFSN